MMVENNKTLHSVYRILKYKSGWIFLVVLADLLVKAAFWGSVDFDSIVISASGITLGFVISGIFIEPYLVGRAFRKHQDRWK